MTDQYGFTPESYDHDRLPNIEHEFISEADLQAFAKALESPSALDRITASNDWSPVNEKVHRRSRSRDETREGNLHSIVRWPLLLWVLFVLGIEGFAYTLTRFYIWTYEHYFTWRGERQILRAKLRASTTYDEWVTRAQDLDHYLMRDMWRGADDFAYYDSEMVADATKQLRSACRRLDEGDETAEADLEVLLRSCVKNNFAGVENTKMYSQTYWGTKTLAQEYIDTVTEALSRARGKKLFEHLNAQFGRTALCLSGGATYSFYHFGVVRALLDEGLLPDVITGTSGGAIVAALVATRTDTELKELLVPALADRITACTEGVTTWFPRWWKTGARFDAVDWARKSSWFTLGSMTFAEAHARTGRILNISCVPSDPHSPTILCNYLTAPDCVIWSAVLASAAVPGILNPVVLMRKKDGVLHPFSFGHKWKDGSLRTDIPLAALNTQFNVNFPIVSQTNPHVNLFFFSSRGAIGRPVTHRKGRGWRGGFLGSAVENVLRLDMIKWLRFMRAAELLPRPMGQDWSRLWLQAFNGTVTIWPKTHLSDLGRILTDPDPQILARMLHEGKQSAFPTLRFVRNRLVIERAIMDGLSGST